MTESEWETTNDAARMLESFWESHPAKAEASEKELHHFYVACCRAIWNLLPQEATRRGIELAEQYLAGNIAADALREFDWDVEGAAFLIDYNTDPQAIRQWIQEVQKIPRAELQLLLFAAPGEVSDADARDLLKRAAYFADYAMIYPDLAPKGPPSESYSAFLSADLLRRYVSNPFRGSSDVAA